METDRRTKKLWEIDNVIAKELKGKCYTSLVWTKRCRNRNGNISFDQKNASITITEMVRLLAVNRRTSQRGLDVLKSTGTIERKGSK